MTKRRQAREWAVQVLFQIDFNPEDPAEALAGFWADKTPHDRVKGFTEQLVFGVVENRAKIDATLQEYAENWDIKRMAGVDRNVMRVAIYEMFFCPDIPPVVSINEAIELAKEFSGNESRKFVNGILDRVRQTLDRPARTPVSTGEGEAEG
ncbi:MAG: transcription antitermination factor NusB [Kiritimatiellae bacterium]|nr:transcription antitermination factor NusB [Kiritimatiellia bacterium]